MSGEPRYNGKRVIVPEAAEHLETDHSEANDYVGSIGKVRNLFTYTFLDLPTGLARFKLYQSTLRFLVAGNDFFFGLNQPKTNLFYSWTYGSLANFDPSEI